jgi:hypothetical protein
MNKQKAKYNYGKIAIQTTIQRLLIFWTKEQVLTKSEEKREKGHSRIKKKSIVCRRNKIVRSKIKKINK